MPAMPCFTAVGGFPSPAAEIRPTGSKTAGRWHCPDRGGSTSGLVTENRPTGSEGGPGIVEPCLCRYAAQSGVRPSGLGCSDRWMCLDRLGGEYLPEGQSAVGAVEARTGRWLGRHPACGQGGHKLAAF